MLNERKYHNGKEILDLPLLSVFGASNELPEENESLEALSDRFLFRYRLSYIQDTDNFCKLLFKTPDKFSQTRPLSMKKLSISTLQKLRKKAEALPVEEEVKLILPELRKALLLQDLEVSDRRWKKVVKVLKVAAYSSERPSVDQTMLLLLQHMLWNLPEERDFVRKTSLKLMVSGGVNLEKLRDDVEDLKTAIGLAQKNALPVHVICDSCGEKFELRQKVDAHQQLHPEHSYCLLQDNSSKIYPYANLVRKLDSLSETSGKPEPLSPLRRQAFKKEFEELETRVKNVKKKLGEEREKLKELMAANIWVTSLDKTETLLLYDSQTEAFSEIEALLKALQKTPGLELEASKKKALDSEKSAESFVKGLSSRFGLR